MGENKGIVHILLIIAGVLVILVLLGFFNSVGKNWNNLPIHTHTRQ